MDRAVRVVFCVLLALVNLGFGLADLLTGEPVTVADFFLVWISGACAAGAGVMVMRMRLADDGE